MERTHASRCVILKANINQFCIVDWPEATCSTCGVFARMDASPLKLLITIATVHYYLPFIIWAAHLHCWPPANTFPGLSASTFHSLRAQCECSWPALIVMVVWSRMSKTKMILESSNDDDSRICSLSFFSVSLLSRHWIIPPHQDVVV